VAKWQSGNALYEYHTAHCTINLINGLQGDFGATNFIWWCTILHWTGGFSRFGWARSIYKGGNA
jgi:hypothetical protein